MKRLPCEIIETTNNPAEIDAAIIWLHGLGADGHDFVPIVNELKLPAHYNIRFIFPHAPSIPVTINQGMVMPAWYDILELSFERKIDYAQIQTSSDAIAAFIDDQIKLGISSQRIILAGFSQGGAVAYHTALSYGKPLCGLLALSTYFATESKIQIHPSNQSIPIQVCHGTVDDVVPEGMGKMAVTKLEQLGLSADYKTYPIAHGVHPQEVADISAWIQARLG